MNHTSTFGSYRGRKALGTEILLGVECVDSNGAPTAPDAAPVMLIYDSSKNLVINKSIPPVERYLATGHFQYMQPLDSTFAVGSYYVRYNYAISGTQRMAQDTFEVVAGGDSNGMVNSAFYLDRPGLNDWMVYVTDMGKIFTNRGPRS